MKTWYYVILYGIILGTVVGDIILYATVIRKIVFMRIRLGILENRARAQKVQYENTLRWCEKISGILERFIERITGVTTP